MLHSDCIGPLLTADQWSSLVGSALAAFELLLYFAWILPGRQRFIGRSCLPYNSFPTAEMPPGNLSQELSQSCISAISIVMPPSVCMNRAETALRMKGRKKLLGREHSSVQS